MLNTSRGGGSAVRVSERRFLAVAHFAPVSPADQRWIVNFAHNARPVHSESVQIAEEWTDGWTELEIVGDGTMGAATGPSWSPYQPLFLRQHVYVVAAPNAGNDALRPLSPLQLPDPIIMSGVITGQLDGAFITLTIPEHVELLGMSGAACVVWDREKQRAVIVGLFCGMLKRGVGVMVRPVKMSERDRSDLIVGPAQTDALFGP